MGDKRWSDGQWRLFSRVPHVAIRRFRDAVQHITESTFTDEGAAFTALTGLIRGWGNYYAYAAASRLMDSLDAYIYRAVWKYCCAKNRKVGVKAIYRKYTLPRHLRDVGYFYLGVVVGDAVIRLPRLSSIPRKALRLSYPPHPYLLNGRDYTLPYVSGTDEHWWDRHLWAGQEGTRTGQRRLATEVVTRDAICQLCQAHPTEEVHHDPPWNTRPQHNPKNAVGVCRTCHRQRLHSAGWVEGELR